MESLFRYKNFVIRGKTNNLALVNPFEVDHINVFEQETPVKITLQRTIMKRLC